MKQANQNSNRSIRRAKRKFILSRCNRRATQRLLSATELYQKAINLPGILASAYTKPGALKKW